MDQPKSSGPKESLSLWDTISLIVGIIVGVGIFRTPGAVFATTDGPLQAFAVWALAGVAVLLGALCFAELASTYPRSGGEYVYLTNSYGRWAGFLFAWAQLLVIRPAGTIGIIAFAFCDFGAAATGVTWSSWFSAFIASSVIVLLTVVNILGVKIGKTTQNVLTGLKVLGILGILIAGFGFSADQSKHRTLVGRVTEVKPEGVVVVDELGNESEVLLSSITKTFVSGEKTNKLQPGWRVSVSFDDQDDAVATEIRASEGSTFSAWGLAMIFVLWTYSGWHEGAYVASEVKDKRTTITRALVFGTVTVMVLYLLINVACYVGLGFVRAGESEAIAADVLGLALGAWGAKAMAILVMISCLGAINGGIFTSSRIFTEMGEDHPLFGVLKHWHRTLGTPVVALVVQGAISVVFVLVMGLLFRGQSGFNELLYCTSAVFWGVFLFVGLGLFRLREANSNLSRPFSVPLYPVVPIIFCNVCAYMTYAAVTFKPHHSLVGLGLVLLGVPVYFLSNLYGKNKAGKVQVGSASPKLEQATQTVETDPTAFADKSSVRRES
ncbi:MAG: APC family permease [Gemmataceae bacterium]